ncbi:MAG: hypothetical protein J6S01_06185 [Bacteroidales bacterium]|nr:hypothetical protein [Bacteroidales bacterium]
MKKILTYISVLLAVCSCSWFDDSKIWEELREHEERIEKLEAICGRLNSNMWALQGIMKALEANDYVTDITRIMEDGVEVGTRQVVRALWVELARLVLSGRPWFWPTAVPLKEGFCYWRGKVYAK